MSLGGMQIKPGAAQNEWISSSLPLLTPISIKKERAPSQGLGQALSPTQDWMDTVF